VDPEKADALVRAVRRLTIAVWVLVALLALYISAYLAVYIPALMNTSWASPPVTRAPPRPSSPPEPFKSLHDLPPEEAIRESSVILLTKYKLEDGKGKCEITEILKHSPGVRFYYKVGDDMRFCSYDPKDGAEHGMGQVVFLVGDPAEMRLSSTYFDERVASFGDIPIDQMRKIIAEQAASPAGAPKTN
jgi:hypothetical protein